ncbi:DUF928 domain-containing protein [Ancylothrix sp. C2]|uniref:DUF928 domain-containing protein n=1 Tax=Ancylothrix sp. D3o TaxID=2953691 RepID=UPI0021BA809C|nr:DUF928 domain-containing protein [Ancylothrix sp. D3o]MCT7951057.1 DUF928 domain-containing protein [Ancylothrix sp. D3o]
MDMKSKNILVLGIIASLIFPSVSIAALPHSQRLISIKFPPPSGRGSPARTAGGGTRNGDVKCTEGKIPLTALMPTRQNVGITVSPNPTFFIYVPQTTAKQGQFVVVDDEGNDIYVDEFDIPSQPGILQINLPDTVSLETGKYNTWMFSLTCNAENRAEDEFVQGLIQRTELSAEAQNNLENATTPVEKAEIYAEAKIWNETLVNLAPMRNSYPESWQELLQSVGLENLVSEPVLPTGT